MAAERQPTRWWAHDHQLWIEAFVIVNFAALAVDVFLAHSENHFRRESEYIPIYCSIAAATTSTIILSMRPRWPAVWRDLGYLVGWSSVVVGLAGVILHLDSRFFFERTIRSLTYAAPFAAPLAYTGLGLLLIVNRAVAPETLEWAQWILFLALGGFAGNFVFSLTDHAQNAFFNPVEWVAVASSALAVGFLVVPLIMPVTVRFLELCAVVVGLQAIVGVAGFLLHVGADLRQPAASLFEKVLTGAPPLAPLLFPNLVVLALIALWVWRLRAQAESPGR